MRNRMWSPRRRQRRRSRLGQSDRHPGYRCCRISNTPRPQDDLLHRFLPGLFRSSFPRAPDLIPQMRFFCVNECTLCRLRPIGSGTETVAATIEENDDEARTPATLTGGSDEVRRFLCSKRHLFGVQLVCVFLCLFPFWLLYVWDFPSPVPLKLLLRFCSCLYLLTNLRCDCGTRNNCNFPLQQEDLEHPDNGGFHTPVQARNAPLLSASSSASSIAQNQSRQSSSEDGAGDSSSRAGTSSDNGTPSSGSGAAVSGGAEPTTTLDSSGLPSNWSMQMAPNGRVFFIDHNLKRTSWVDPRTGRASPMPNALSKPTATNDRPEDDIGPLPEGWEERVHSDGRIFYIDHSENVQRSLSKYP